jgi:hypothetical protein
VIEELEKEVLPSDDLQKTNVQMSRKAGQPLKKTGGFFIKP